MASAVDPKERRAAIVTARRSGDAFRAIGAAWGISPGRARALYLSGLRDERDAPPPGPVTRDTPGGELPVSRRARNVLWSLGLTLAELMAAPARELAVTILREPNGNQRVVNEVSAYLEEWRVTSRG